MQRLSRVLVITLIGLIAACARATPTPTATPVIPTATLTPIPTAAPTEALQPTDISGTETAPSVSLPITSLVPFVHEPTGITGLRPENWAFASGETAFRASSGAQAPDDFIGFLIPPEQFPEGGAAQASRDTLESFKKNQVEGPAPDIIEERTFEDGTGSLIASITTAAEGSNQPIRVTLYARTDVTSKGLLVVIAIVPAEQFPAESNEVLQMVDSVHIP
jgi:hypothetical protein